MNRRVTGALVLALGLAACAKDAKVEPAAEKPRSQRERDSVLGQSSVPGASGVGKAITVADSAGNRVYLQDSIATSE